MGDPSHYHISDDEPLMRFLKTVHDTKPDFYTRLMEADDTNTACLTRNQFKKVLTGYLVPKADFHSLERVAGFSETGKGEYIEVKAYIKRIKDRANHREKIELETFKKIKDALVA
jgi:Ca2+-binding EF-hand superfamily protein